MCGHFFFGPPLTSAAGGGPPASVPKAYALPCQPFSLAIASHVRPSLLREILLGGQLRTRGKGRGREGVAIRRHDARWTSAAARCNHKLLRVQLLQPERTHLVHPTRTRRASCG